jgi:hypothetical protein
MIYTPKGSLGMHRCASPDRSGVFVSTLNRSTGQTFGNYNAASCLIFGSDQDPLKFKYKPSS